MEIMQGKNHRGVYEAHVVQVEGPGGAGEKGADGQGNVFIADGIDPQRFGGILVFANGNKIVAQLGMHHQRDCPQAEDGEPEGQIKIGKFAAEALDDQYSHHAFGKVHPVVGHQPEDFTGCQGAQGKIRPPQAKAELADEKAQDNGRRARPAACPTRRRYSSLVWRMPAV